MKKQRFQKPLALLLALMLLVSLLPLSAFAAEGDITVSITVENAAYTAPEAPWTGTLFSEPFTVGSGSTMLEAVESALTAKGISFTEYGGYISEINGLTAGAAGGYDGWAGTLDGIAPGVGFGSVYLKEGDTICIRYVTDWNSLSWGSANNASSGFAFSAGVFSYEEGAWSTALTLTLPADQTGVQVTAVPNPDDKEVRIYQNGALTGGLNTEISVAGGDALQIVLGSYETVYDVAVRTVPSTAEGQAAETAALRTNIAAAYVQDASDYWHVLGVQAYGGPGYGDSLKQSYVDAAVAALVSAEPASVAGTPAMQILALRSLGYDPARLVDADGAAGNAYDILSSLTCSSTEETAYTLLALLQSDPTAYGETIDAEIIARINAAVAALESTQVAQDTVGYWDGGWGYYADTTASALLALCLAETKGYAVDADVVSKAVGYLESQILADGTVPGDNNGSEGNANTTAMVTMALKAAGGEPSLLTRSGGGNTLLQGLLLFATGGDTGFVYANSFSNTYNDYATKQAFLGLTAAVRGPGAYNCFDFTGTEADAAATSTAPAGCLVMVSGVPSDASVAVSLDTVEQTKRADGRYDLPAGTYAFTASKSGYHTQNGSFTVTAEEAEGHAAKSVPFTLSPDEQITEQIYLTVSGPSGTLYGRQPMTWYSGMTPLSALHNTGLDVVDMGGYVSSIEQIAQFDYGAGSGWLYSVNGVTPSGTAAGDYRLADGDRVLWYYTTDYTRDSSSSEWSGLPAGQELPAGTVAPAAAVVNGTATADISAELLSGAIQAVKDGSASVITIAPETTGEVSAMHVTLPAASVREIAADTGAQLLLRTPVGSVTLDKGALASVAEQAGGSDLEFSLEAKTAAEAGLPAEGLENSIIVSVQITSGGETITRFGGNTLTISLPVDDTYTPGEFYKVVVLSADGTAETHWGQAVAGEGGTFVEITTPHLSTFVVTGERAGVFADVAEDAWYAGAVRFVTAKELFQGTGEDTFSPDAAMTRAMLATVLYRMAGSPAAAGASPFADVKAGAWYADAVAWASENGIVQGIGDGLYGTDRPVSRQELATMLCRFAAYRGLDVTQAADLTAYADTDGISDWALDAMKWANAARLITGVTSSALEPAGHATRAAVATVLMRFAENAAE